MNEHEFSLKLTHIEEQYRAKREGADAYRDQELARLFVDCGWTQEKIGKRMGQTQSWVSRRLIFGRFLSFMPDRHKLTDLTEFRFRSHYSKTKGDEANRFRQVLNVLTDGVPPGYRNIVKKPGIKKAILDLLSDGKSYTTQQIHATVEETIPGVEVESISNAIRGLIVDDKVVGKHKGRTHKYRLKKGGPARSTDSPPDFIIKLYEEAKPLIDELDEWGQAYEYQMSPSCIRNIAIQLRRLFDTALETARA